MLKGVLSQYSRLNSLQLHARQFVQRQQVAWNWQAVLRRRMDRRTGQVKYEDWDYVIKGFQEPTLLDGTSILGRHLANERHFKPTTIRKRLNSQKVYKRSVKKIDDLLSYVKFMQEKGKY